MADAGAPAPAGMRGVEVPPEIEGLPKPPPSAAIPPRLVLGYVDLSIRGVLEYERYDRVYVSPWWELEGLPEGTHAWKRAVLERVPMHGATHWGHLFLVVADATGPRRLGRLRRVDPMTRVVAPYEAELTLSLRDGLQRAELIAHPTRRTPDEPLRGFAREIEARFRRQMD